MKPLPAHQIELLPVQQWTAHPLADALNPDTLLVDPSINQNTLLELELTYSEFGLPSTQRQHQTPKP